MKHIVISAVNLVEGGTFKILKDCLRASQNIKNLRVTAIVNSNKEIELDGINFIIRPDIKGSWLRRIFFEYYECCHIAKKIKPDLWLSLHDTTPNLKLPGLKIPQVVYCHNGLCFYDMSMKEIFLDPHLYLFSKVYLFLYKVNLNDNAAVIVQQQWFRDKFKLKFKYNKEIIVAHPVNPIHSPRRKPVKYGKKFIYPSYARVFKNYEVVLEAWKLVLQYNPLWDGELILTIDKSINRYSRYLVKKFNTLRGVTFVGLLPSSEISSLYDTSDCLVFPSKLETWGLPITEAKEAGLFILASDLPFAHEAVGQYDAVSYFNPCNPHELAKMIMAFRNGHLKNTTNVYTTPDRPFANNWETLFSMLMLKTL